MNNRAAGIIVLAAVLSCLAFSAPACAGRSSPSAYEGTYSGTFYYDYQTVTWDADKELPGGAITSFWKPATIGIELTFKTIPVPATPGWVTLEITHILCDDPVFGAGSTGIVPDNSSGLNAYVVLPVPPDRNIKNDEGIKININFPNGSYIISAQTASNRGTFVSSPDGKSLSYSFVFSGSIDYTEGAFKAFAATGPFSPAKEYPEYYIRAKSWTLIKVAS